MQTITTNNKGERIVEFKKNSVIGPPIDIRLTENDLLNIFTKNGFSKIKYEDVGEFNYILILKKNN